MNQIEYIRGNLRLLKEHDLLKDSQILDIGCGTGESLRVFQDEGAVAVGIDLNSKDIFSAKNSGFSNLLVVGDAHALPFKSRSFDLITCFATLCSLDNIKALYEIKRAVKKNNHIFLTLHSVGFYTTRIIDSLKGLNFYWLRLLFPLLNGVFFNLFGKQLSFFGNKDVFYTFNHAKNVLKRHGLEIVDMEFVKTEKGIPYFMMILGKRF